MSPICSIQIVLQTEEILSLRPVCWADSAPFKSFVTIVTTLHFYQVV